MRLILLLSVLLSWTRLFRLKRKVKIQTGPSISIGRNCTFEGCNALQGHDSLRDVFMGYATYISEYVALENCKIGKYSCIGPRVRIIRGKHPSSTWVSVHPAFYSTRNQTGVSYVKEDKYEEFAPAKYEGYSTSIGNDVWIGADVRIIEGVKIGDGAIIAAGAVITRDVSPYTIVGGVPAKFIRYRFTPDQISVLTASKWWDKDAEWIKENVNLFEAIENYCSVIGE